MSNGDKTVTVTLKNWKWSDGESVTSRDVEFWMNMMFAREGQLVRLHARLLPRQRGLGRLPQRQHGGVPPEEGGQPDLVPLQRAVPGHPDAHRLGPHVCPPGATPTPSTPNLPDTTPAGVAKVYNYLNTQATNVASYATSPLWSVVDGPWKLQSFTTPVRSPSCPTRPTAARPSRRCPSSSRCPSPRTRPASTRSSRGARSALSMAELPDEYLPQLKSIEGEGYNAVNFTDFSFSYFPLNLGNPTFGPVFRQLYFRQAFQHLVDGPGWMEKILGGYAVPTYGPVPTAPLSPLVDSYERNNPYPFSVSDAAKLLKAHGWTNVGSGPGGYCAKPGSGPGECGAGVPKGLQLKFNLIPERLGGHGRGDGGPQVPGRPGRDRPRADHRSLCPGRRQGHRLRPDGGRPSPAQPSAPGRLSTGAPAGSTPPTSCPRARRSSTRVRRRLLGLQRPRGRQADRRHHHGPASLTIPNMHAYEDYMAKQLPVVFFPTATGNPTSAAIDLISKHLGGFINNVYTNLTPETWYLTK